MATQYKTLRDFINVHFMLRPMSDINDPHIVVLTDFFIISIGNGSVNETPYLYGNTKLFFDIFEQLKDREQLEDEYNFKFMYINDKPCLVNRNYVDTLTTKQATYDITYIKFNNGEEYHF